MAGGYIKLYRKIRDHWVWQNAEYLKWWLDLLMLANHEPRKIAINGKIRLMDVGEHHTSILKLSERWYIDRKTVKKFLKMLENDGMIILEKSRQNGTTVKVLNYKDYQAFSEGDKDNGADIDGTTARTSKGQQDGHKQEPKELEALEEPKELKKKEKEENPKEPVSAKPPRSYAADSTEQLATQFLINKILERNPHAQVPKDDAQIGKWCDAANKILRLDQKPVNEFKKVLEFAATDSFWSANILSMAKFREKYDQLYAKMAANAQPAKRKEPPLSGIEKLRLLRQQAQAKQEGDIIDL